MQKAKPKVTGDLPRTKARGFTLLELIIVIAILAILSVAVVLVINPAETLKRARDSQRLSDLAAIKSAIGLYLAEVSLVDLNGGLAATNCAEGATGRIWYSTATDITDASVPADRGADASGGTWEAGATGWATHVATGSVGEVDGTGWVPVNLSAITGLGSPLSNFPIDPINSLTLGDVTSADSLYRYTCNDTDSTFEINGVLESSRYTTKMTEDGGDNNNFYETGTSILLLPTGTDF